MKDYIYHNDDVNIVIDILSKENKELIYIVPTIEEYSEAYSFYYKHKDIDSARFELDNYENLVLKMEPLIKDKFEEFLLSIGIKNKEPHKINQKNESDYIRDIEKKDEIINKIELEKKDTNRQLALTTQHLLKEKDKRKKLMYSKSIPTKEEMITLIDAHRFKESQKVNCSAIGRILGIE